jgi:adenylate cyclase
MGGEKRFDYSAIGDAVNVAARLESSTRKYTQDVLIGETTAKAVPHMAEYLDSIEVKGKSEKLSVYTLSEDAIHAAHLADYWVAAE